MEFYRSAVLGDLFVELSELTASRGALNAPWAIFQHHRERRVESVLKSPLSVDVNDGHQRVLASAPPETASPTEREPGFEK